MKIKSIMLFSNGNTIVFDESGQQIPELQKAWMQVWIEWMESQGIDMTEVPTIETIVNGRNVYICPFKTEDGWNWRITDF